jgi:glycosyltransferase involved in cell wall biosynthesis
VTSDRPRERRRICYVETQDWAFSSHRARLGRAALDAGFEVHVLAPPSGAEARLREAGFVFHPLRMQRGSLNPLGESLAIADLVRAYRSLRPDVVHHIALKAVLYGSVAARVARVGAVVGSVTGLGYSFIPGGASRRLLRGAVSGMLRAALSTSRAHTVFQNPDDRRLFIELGIATAERSRVVLGSGVDTRRFAPSPEPEGDPVVLVGTRMLYDKGILELVEAARALKSQGVSFRLVLAGAPDPKNPASIAEERLRAWQAEGLVEWLGQVDDMAGLLRRCHVACLPSYREGLPLFLAEAAASGRPLVGTDVPGCRAVVRDGETGLCVPARDVGALATALGRLIDDARLRHRLGAAARTFAEAELSDERIVFQLLSLYEELMAAC